MSHYKYQEEYEATEGLFWDNKPAKFVRLFSQIMKNRLDGLEVLDLGAGEGKNAVFLASLGANVTAIDISGIALSKFALQDGFSLYKDRIKTAQADISTITIQNSSFDVVVAYGILHCLKDKAEIERVIAAIKHGIKPKGYFVGATFTDNIPPPSIQSYLEAESFLSEGELEHFFADWNILYKENDIIHESHPTSLEMHAHSLVRLIAQRN